ncbi:MAG: hypothetical protein ABRQ37_20985 [Candidatus Eremiobacterota bacterium]
MLSQRFLEELLILTVKRVVNVSEKNSSVEIQEEESKHIKENEEDEFSLSTMFGVALIGAATSATLYYIYTQLSKETKASLKDIVIGSVTKKLVSLTCEEKNSK